VDKIFSARVDVKSLDELDMLTRRLKTSKKAVLEGAIHAYAEKILADTAVDVFTETAGAWQRDETPQESVHQAKKPFQDAIARHQKP
jgi:hypothetical protein